MNAALECNVTILVKALPQPSTKHGETVCCAGVTPQGDLKRLFPVRFRHLSGDKSFKRWDRVEFKYRQPTSDRRPESRHVFEDSIVVSARQMPKRQRAAFLEPLLSGSVSAANAAGKSLALIRPRNTEFYFKPKKPERIEEERRAYEKAASQGSFFDEQLAALDPSPYEFRFRFEDDAKAHDYANNDWEAHAMFWNGHRREGSEKAALGWMSKTFNDEYPEKGMLFCVGNMASRPQTWLLLGVLRVDEIGQQSLF